MFRILPFAPFKLFECLPGMFFGFLGHVGIVHRTVYIQKRDVNGISQDSHVAGSNMDSRLIATSLVNLLLWGCHLSNSVVTKEINFLL